MNRNYRLVVIFNPDAKAAEAVVAVKNVLKELGAQVLGEEAVVPKKLAYEVGGFRDGQIYIATLTAPADLPTKRTTELNIETNVLRFLISQLETSTKSQP